MSNEQIVADLYTSNSRLIDSVIEVQIEIAYLHRENENLKRTIAHLTDRLEEEKKKRLPIDDEMVETQIVEVPHD